MPTFHRLGDTLWLRIAVLDELPGTTNDAQSLLDDVNITLIPEPTSVGLLAVGLAFAMGRGRRR